MPVYPAFLEVDPEHLYSSAAPTPRSSEGLAGPSSGSGERCRASTERRLAEAESGLAFECCLCPFNGHCSAFVCFHIGLT